MLLCWHTLHLKTTAAWLVYGLPWETIALPRHSPDLLFHRGCYSQTKHLLKKTSKLLLQCQVVLTVWHNSCMDLKVFTCVVSQAPVWFPGLSLPTITCSADCWASPRNIFLHWGSKEPPTGHQIMMQSTAGKETSRRSLSFAASRSRALLSSPAQAILWFFGRHLCGLFGQHLGKEKETWLCLPLQEGAGAGPAGRACCPPRARGSAEAAVWTAHACVGDRQGQLLQKRFLGLPLQRLGFKS